MANANPQHMEALQEANRVRAYRHHLKQAIKNGETSVVDIILEPPSETLTMWLVDVLTAVPRFGVAKTGTLLKRADVSPRVSLAALTARQRSVLAGALTLAGVK